MSYIQPVYVVFYHYQAMLSIQYYTSLLSSLYQDYARSSVIKPGTKTIDKTCHTKIWDQENLLIKCLIAMIKSLDIVSWAYSVCQSGERRFKDT